ncbi:MAG: metallophosphoesterase family protein [Clostridia bacterium]|nr:metallophosphoesterase family protein [Clostridia bacterium]
MFMRVGVISDSHYIGGAPLPKALELLQHMGVSKILHAGDVGDLSFLQALEKIAPVDIVAGNCDGLNRAESWGRKKIVEINGVSIGLIHGDGIGDNTPSRALKAFASQKVNAVVFGHSHQPLKEERDGIMLFNPGSCKLPRGKDPRPSFGLFFIEEGKLKADIIYFGNI